MHAGNEHSAASAYVSCYAQIIAKVFATAIAEATASANCWANGGDAHAVATIEAEVRAELEQYEVCHINISETGTADGSVDGSSAFTLPVCLPFARAHPCSYPPRSTAQKLTEAVCWWRICPSAAVRRQHRVQLLSGAALACFKNHVPGCV